MNLKNFTLDIILKYTTAFYLFLVINGVFFAHIYYSAFGIRIFEYIGLTEVLTVFMFNLYQVFILVIFAAIPTIYFSTIGFKYSVKKFSKLYGEKRAIILMLSLAFLGCILTGLFHRIKDEYPWILIIALVSFCFAVLVAPVLINMGYLFVIEKWMLPKSKTIPFFMSVLFNFIVINGALAYIEKYVGPYRKFEIEFNDSKKITESDGYILVGKTLNYLFVSKKNERKTIVIKLDVVKTISHFYQY